MYTWCSVVTSDVTGDVTRALKRGELRDKGKTVSWLYLSSIPDRILRMGEINSEVYPPREYYWKEGILPNVFFFLHGFLFELASYIAL